MQCRIWIHGHLDQSWQEWFEHLEILPQASGKTLLSGSLRDQAALYRVLLKIQSLGLVLISMDTDEFLSNQEKQP